MRSGVADFLRQKPCACSLLLVASPLRRPHASDPVIGLGGSCPGWSGLDCRSRIRDGARSGCRWRVSKGLGRPASASQPRVRVLSERARRPALSPSQVATAVRPDPTTTRLPQSGPPRTEHKRLTERTASIGPGTRPAHTHISRHPPRLPFVLPDRNARADGERKSSRHVVVNGNRAIEVDEPRTVSRIHLVPAITARNTPPPHPRPIPTPCPGHWGALSDASLPALLRIPKSGKASRSSFSQSDKRRDCQESHVSVTALSLVCAPWIFGLHSHSLPPSHAHGHTLQTPLSLPCLNCAKPSALRSTLQRATTPSTLG